MNPLTNVKNINKLNEVELSTGLIHKKSWHDMYKESAWIFIGGLEYGLTEGDVLAVFSQYGEIVNINLVRDKKTGKSKGFCFLCYANQKSTVLAVDNLNGIKLCNRTIRVDHVANYKPPKENERDDEVTKILKVQGCAPEVSLRSENNEAPDAKAKKKKSKKVKKEKKKKKKKSHSSDSDQETSTVREVEVKKEKRDPGYDKYDTTSNHTNDTMKRKYLQNNVDNLRGVLSTSHKNYKLKDMNYHGRDRDNCNGRYHQKIKSEPESDEDSGIHAGPSKRYSRKRSRTPSDNATGKYRDHSHYNHDKKERERHSNYSKRYKDTKQSSSSSSDNDSSSESSSDAGNKNRYSEKEKYKQHFEMKSGNKDSRDKNHGKSDKAEYTSSKSRYYAESEKHSDYKSRTKRKNDNSDDDFSGRSSHYKSKHRR